MISQDKHDFNTPIIYFTVSTMEQGTDSQHVNGHIPNGWVTNGSAVSNKSEKHSVLQSAWQYATIKRLLFCLLIIPLFLTHFLGLPVYIYPLVIVLAFLPLISFFVGINNFLYVLSERRNQVSKIDKYIEFLDDDCKAQHSGKFMPIRDLYELYADGKINFKGDVLETLERRNEYISYQLQWWHLKFILSKLVPELFHGKQQDREQVCDHYDRGNDFYESFLGQSMVYTSGMRHMEDDTLEDMQKNKIEEISQKVRIEHFHFIVLFTLLNKSVFGIYLLETIKCSIVWINICTSFTIFTFTIFRS